MPQKPTYEELEKRVRELEQTELESKQIEEDLTQIFSMSLDMICIADIETATFIKVNPAFSRDFRAFRGRISESSPFWLLFTLMTLMPRKTSSGKN